MLHTLTELNCVFEAKHFINDVKESLPKTTSYEMELEKLFSFLNSLPEKYEDGELNQKVRSYLNQL